ncbi:MAG: acyl-CoA carboxylase subunit beta [Deltaproteobacteria bacterium]|nr:acyl-CoA carboxylase subunit beta [Deltaproteobacteria bacterium]
MEKNEKMRAAVEDLAARREKAREMGGPERVAKQHARGKMDVRQRIDALLDPGSFLELGMHAQHEGNLPEKQPKPSPADGCVTGIGALDGRPVAVAAYDFTVYGGSIGMVAEHKVTRLRDLALKERLPIIWLVDSGGARLSADGGMDPRAISEFAGTGYLFREQSILSGVIPQVAAMVGPGAAGTAYIPGLADFVPMVKEQSSMAIGGPYLTKSVVGEDVTEEELGGSKVHTEKSGVADLQVKDDAACIQAIKDYLSYFPSSCTEKPPRGATRVEPDSLIDDEILDIIPENRRRAYDMRKILKLVVDEGVLFEMKPKWARNITTAFARIDGWPVGIVANNPQYYGGILDVDSADKAARFVNLCDSFNIPLCFFQDVPGFMVGTKVEQAGIIRHGAKMLQAVSLATVPKLTVVVRKAYGAGYYVMNGRAYEPDLLVSWPGGEISVMGAEGMVAIAAQKLLAAAENPEEIKEQLAAGIRPYIDINQVAAMGHVDDVIDPRETRTVLAKALLYTRNKTVERPWRKGPVRPV